MSTMSDELCELARKSALSGENLRIYFGKGIDIMVGIDASELREGWGYSLGTFRWPNGALVVADIAVVCLDRRLTETSSPGGEG